MITEESIVIDASPEGVFDVLADLEASVAWSSQLEECRLLEEGPLKVGSTYYQKIKVFGRIVQYEYRIKVFDRETLSIVTECEDEVMPVDVHYNVMEDKGKTVVHMKSEGETGTVFKTIASPILKMLTAKSMRLFLSELKTHVETPIQLKD